jgi:hypothetical protein
MGEGDWRAQVGVVPQVVSRLGTRQARWVDVLWWGEVGEEASPVKRTQQNRWRLENL